MRFSLRKKTTIACFTLFILTLFFWGLVGNIQAQLYRYTDEKGTVHFTDNPPNPKYEPINEISQFWASKESNKYHYPSCQWAQKIKPSNLIKFNSPAEALKAGYIPCRVCNPLTSSEPPINRSRAVHPRQPEPTHTSQIYCTRVIDGDTIVVDIKGKQEKVRLIGVDTPETKHPKKPVERFGKEAYLFTKEMVEGKEVRLESDQQRRDRYGRLLAYVYLMDGTFLNAEIIKQGYGFAYTRYPFKYLEKFRGYEREARENKRGLWE